MGNIRRIKKSIMPKIAMADAHISVNGCQVFLGHPSERQALAAAKGFAKMLNIAIGRSDCPNMSDVYNASFIMQGKIANGESIFN